MWVSNVKRKFVPTNVHYIVAAVFLALTEQGNPQQSGAKKIPTINTASNDKNFYLQLCLILAVCYKILRC